MIHTENRTKLSGDNKLREDFESSCLSNFQYIKNLEHNQSFNLSFSNSLVTHSKLIALYSHKG